MANTNRVEKITPKGDRQTNYSHITTDNTDDFWEKVSEDDRISDEFREYLNQENPVGQDSSHLISRR